MGFKPPKQAAGSSVRNLWKQGDLQLWSSIERFNLEVAYELICETEEATATRPEEQAAASASRDGVVDPLSELHAATPKGLVRARTRTLRAAGGQGRR